MPRQKDLKRLVRTRMKKTGEAYTTARAQIVRQPRSLTTAAKAALPGDAVKPAPSPAEFAALAGMRDDAIKEKTGCTWERWVFALDRCGAATMPHREIAKLVKEKYKINSWWSQSVTVGYERIKGRRVPGQMSDGSFAFTKTRTLGIASRTLFERLSDASFRRRWLEGRKTTVRSAKPPTSIRLAGAEFDRVTLEVTAKGDGRSVLVVTHAKLPGKEAVDRLKHFWAQRLNALRDQLAKERTRT
ncbi:MAG: hypothetical protein ABIZ91_18475 [Gemmatimonadaceae bacterium]